MTALCAISGPITIVSASGFEPALGDRLSYSLENRLTVNDVAGVLNRMAGGVPTVLKEEYSETHGQQRVAYFCTPVFVARCVAKDKYLMLALNAPDYIYRRLPNWRSILVRPTRWYVLSRGRGKPAAAHKKPATYFQIQECFEKRAGEISRSYVENGLSPAQQVYLETLRNHIALTRQVEQDRARNRPIVAFTAIAATDAERVARESYEFKLDAPNPFSPREFVEVGMEGMDPNGRRERARVIATHGRRLTLKFERQVDVARVPRPGVIGFTFNDVQQRIQERALDALRDGRALNPRLLDIIVDGEYVPYSEPPKLEQGSLNPSQDRALRCAQEVEDIFLVQGPPGTGKTFIITALAESLASEKAKILVTSKNNRAVDNVLEKLGDLRVVRIGHEDVVSPDARPLLIDVQAQKLQEEIAVATDGPYRQLKEALPKWAKAEAEIDELRDLPTSWNGLLDQRQRNLEAVCAAQTKVWQKQESHLKQQAISARRAHRRTARAIRRANRATSLLEWVLSLRNSPLTEALAVISSSWLSKRASRARQQAEAERDKFQRVVKQYENSVAQYTMSARESPPVLTAKRALREVDKALELLAKDVRARTERIHALCVSAPIDLPVPVVETPEALTAYLNTITALKKVVECRHRLLSEWRELLKERRQALYPTLVRSADVVGATCIGIATNPYFRDLEFNTVIADEAGQIQVCDLLVPLVRARRAVLVGDHKQLGPYVDEDVRALLEAESEESVALLEQSLFERLFDVAPQTHKAILDTQYRMPASIADFVSQVVYEGKYQSAPDCQTESVDPFFSRAICFIDTEHRKRYRDKQGKGDETGYMNPEEAKVLAQLAAAYMDRGYEVGVIVPYVLQVRETRQALRALRPDLDGQALRDIVATVDSFQGKQRDTILFGFTRSNKWGGIGFLRDLRRLNVTITRAQRQLVLVGDRFTLTRAADLLFREFATNLLAYVKRKGQYVKVNRLGETLSGKIR